MSQVQIQFIYKQVRSKNVIIDLHLIHCSTASSIKFDSKYFCYPLKKDSSHTSNDKL